MTRSSGVPARGRHHPGRVRPATAVLPGTEARSIVPNIGTNFGRARAPRRTGPPTTSTRPTCGVCPDRHDGTGHRHVSPAPRPLVLPRVLFEAAQYPPHFDDMVQSIVPAPVRHRVVRPRRIPELTSESACGKSKRFAAFRPYGWLRRFFRALSSAGEAASSARLMPCFRSPESGHGPLTLSDRAIEADQCDVRLVHGREYAILCSVYESSLGQVRAT